MIQALRRAFAAFGPPDTPGGAVPVMDGPLRPNRRLDEAPLRLALADVDNLVASGDRLLCSQGTDLVLLRDGADGSLREAERHALPAPITCLAAGPDGSLAIGLDGQGVLLRGGPRDGTLLTAGSPSRLTAPTAATFVDADTLIVANGSADRPAGQWKHDLMAKGASGSVWRLGLRDGRATPLATGLAFPSGVASDGRTGLFVSEAWRHRVLRLEAGEPGAPANVLEDLPAYPGRIAAAHRGGFWLALFAPRNPLVEFVLDEPLYRARMMERVAPDHWIAPALASGRSFLEPIQGGARKKLNQLKPWSPSWSYGLLVRTDAAFAPLESLHSRADGAVHGVTCLCEAQGRTLAGAKGAGRIVEIAP